MSREKKKLKKALSESKVPTLDQFMAMDPKERMHLAHDLQEDSEKVQKYMMEETAFEMNECSVCFRKFPTKLKETQLFFKKYCDECFPKQQEVQQKARRTIEEIFKK
jgi:hypothetical protein